MNKKIIKAAIKDGTLRKYDLTQALAGDKVLGWQPGEVLAVYGEEVVIGWDTTDGKSANIFLTNEYHEVYLAPLCWVEGKPVYKGDVLYQTTNLGNTREVIATRLDTSGEYLKFEDGGSWSVTGTMSNLSWTEPAILYLVGSKPLKVGDVVFSRDGDKVTVEALEMGYVITTPGQVTGYTKWATDYLHWTDPTILFEVEGKPVRKGDVLYAPRGMVVKRVVSHVIAYETYDKEHNRVTALRVYGDDGLWNNPEKLTWTKPKTPIMINGHDVPAPERTPPKNGTEYWVPDFCEKSLTRNWVWRSNVVDTRVLAHGIVHLTKEAAFAHAKALLSFNTK